MFKQLGIKYGAPLKQCRHLLKVAHDLKLNVIGVRYTLDLWLVLLFVDDGYDDDNLPSLSVLIISWWSCYMYSLSLFMCFKECLLPLNNGIKVLFFYTAFMLAVDAMMQVLLELLSLLLAAFLTLGLVSFICSFHSVYLPFA